MKIMIGAQVFWIGLVCLVGAWWGFLLLRQASKIAQLEVAAGMASGEAHMAWMRTQRMLYGESTAFLTLLILSTGFLFRLYWLEMRRSRSMQAFFASVTHELRTPLTSIRLQAESIAESCSGESERDLVKRLLEDTTRLEAQVERTLELARVEGGGAVFAQPLRLLPWLTRFVQTAQESYGKRVSFETDIDDVVAEADPTALQVVFRNLLENSVKHALKEPVKVSVRAKASSGNVEILFRDDGKGYSGDQSDLGGLFFRGSSSQGSGVGLYLVKMLMAGMKGSASFESRNGFLVKLVLRESSHG